MSDIFTRLFAGEIECTSSHASPRRVTYAAGLDLCEVEPSCVTFGDTTFKFDSCLNALFGDVGYVVAFDHGQQVRLYSKDGEPLPTMDDAVSCVFDKQPWQLIEKQPIAKTIMDQIQGLEGEVLADKLREIAQSVENNANVNANKKQFLKSGSSIVTLCGHVGCLVGTEAVAFLPKYIVRLVNGHELLVSEYDVTFVRKATEHEAEYFLYMRSCYDAEAYCSTCKESDFTEAVGKCAPDIQRQATYWYSSARSIAFGLGGLPEQYKETSQDIMQVKADKKAPKQQTLRAWTVCIHLPTGRLCCVVHQGYAKDSDGYRCLFVDGSSSWVHCVDLSITGARRSADQKFFQTNDELGPDSFEVLNRHPAHVQLFGTAMYSGISEELQRQAIACKLAGQVVVTHDKKITTMWHEPKLPCSDKLGHIFKLGDRVCVRPTGTPAIVSDVSRLVTIVDIFGATASVLPQKLTYASRARQSEILLFEELEKGNFFFTPEMQKKFANVHKHLLKLVKEIYSTSEDEEEDDEC